MVADGRSWDWVEYFVRTYKELLDKKAAGLIASDKLEQFFLNWRHVVNGQSESVQSRVKYELKGLERRHRLHRSFLFRIYSWLLRKYLGTKSLQKFSGVMESAGFIDAPLA